MSGSLIGALRVSLGLDSAQFEQGVKRVRGEADRAGKGISTSFGAAAVASKLLGGALASISVGAIAGLARSIGEFADNLGTASEQVGINVERLQTLREGLRALEVPAETQDKIFQRLLTTLGEVQGGTAGAGVVAVLDRMGITAAITNGQIATTDQLLDAIAAAATRYTTQAQFAADVTELVGKRAGPALAAALADGGAGLKNLEQGFRDVGGVIDQEQIQKLADANEAWDSFITRTQSRLTIFAADTIKLFERLGIAIDNVTGRQDLATRSGLITARMKAVEELESLKRGTFGFLPVSPQVIANAEKRVADLSKKMLAMEVRNPALTDPMSRIFPLNADGSFGAARAAGAPPPASGGGSRRSGLAPKQEPSWLQKVLRGDYDTPIDKGALEIVSPEQMEAVKQVAADVSLIAVSVPIISETEIFKLDALEAASGFAESIANTIGQAVVFSGDIGKALVNSFKAAAAEVITSGLMDILLGGRGAGGRRGGGLIGSLLGIPGFANGTNYAPGGLAMVGERGRELVQLPRGSRVIPNGQTEAMMGGRQMHVTVGIDPRNGNLTAFVNGQIAATAPAIAQAGASIAQGQAAQRAQRRYR